jgi:DNA polymerase-3 subunit epsilon
MSWADDPILAFDLETTGPDPETAHIVQAALVYIKPAERSVSEQVLLADPGVEIPAEATAVHGITTNKAQAEGRPLKEVVEDLRAAISAAWATGVPVIAYNAGYDLTVLDREIGRISGDRLAVGPVVDPFVLDKQMERYRKGSRKLIDTCKHYGIVLSEEDAHGAAADALAAARLAWKLAKAYPDVGEAHLSDLHDAQVEWARKQALGLAQYFDRQGNPDAAANCRARVWPLTPRPEKEKVGLW